MAYGIPSVYQGIAGITSPGGAFVFEAGRVRSEYFAGSFLIDTGYDDPVAWNSGADPAEIYAARLYGAVGAIYPDISAGIYTGTWRLEGTPVWSTKFWKNPHGNTPNQRRIFIRVDAYLSEPVSIDNGSWQRLDSVHWGLYRV